jgi:CheY-like chemotaxis protein
MRTLRVLVVDDDVMIGTLLAEMLTDMGHVCSIESTEPGAVAAAARWRPQLMIVDVKLGVGSGVAAVEAITRDKRAAIPHVFISGDIISLLAVRPGAVALQKPFREPELVLAMRHALERQAAY